ncbi:platelet-activating factor acetylhydrolase IB subunit alpha1 [Ischnura elegans]|uniref:platelet-activating factor acetylhydrolase IB subunit alpha1 n=1 Tax=Ischnura elegans TaxID=197161 RepID=UPI001ED8AF1A|nr:platelet-activating factor acetylhydrolase IB subunit alpha1 [Ischnura elegans]
MNPASTPTQPEDIQGDGRWMSMHKRFLAETMEKEPEILFIGDSLITHLSHTNAWNRWFAPMHALCFGIGGDQTQHVLWRVQNGELEGISPKIVVVLVGTNNHGHNPEQIAEGILEIVKVIRQKQPQAQVVVCSLLPRGQFPNHLRERNIRVNQILKEGISDLSDCHLVDSSEGFVQPLDDSISHLDMYDYLHLTEAGYSKAFAPVNTILRRLLGLDQEEEEEVEYVATEDESEAADVGKEAGGSGDGASAASK